MTTTSLYTKRLAETALRRASQSLAQRCAVPLVAFLGDSLTDWADNANGTATQWTAITYIPYLRRLLGPRIATDRSLVLGVASQGVAHLLSTQVPAALAAGVDIAFIQSGSNDVGTLTAQQAIATMTVAVQALIAAGTTVVLIAVSPQSGWNSARRQQAAEMNRAFARLARSLKGVLFVDIADAYVDYATGNAISGHQYSDNVHDSPAGSLAKAQRILAAVDAIIPKYNACPPMSAVADYDATLAPHGNLLTNAVFGGTGGTLAAFGSAAAPTGQIAGNWYARWASTTATTATAAFAKASHPANGSLATQTVTLGGTGDSNWLRMMAASTNGTAGVAIPAGLPVATPFVLEAELGWTGLTGVSAVTLYLSMSDGTTPSSGEDGSAFTPNGTSAIALPPTFTGGHFRTPPVTVPAGVTSIGAELRIIPMTGQALAGTISIGRASLQRG